MKYLFEKKSMNARQIIWLKFLCEFDFDIKHIKGKDNKVVDALSRRVHPMHASIVSMFKSNLNTIILEVIISDEHYLQLKLELQ